MSLSDANKIMWRKSRIIPGRIQRINDDYTIDDAFFDDHVENSLSMTDSFETYDSSVSQDWDISDKKEENKSIINKESKTSDFIGDSSINNSLKCMQQARPGQCVRINNVIRSSAIAALNSNPCNQSGLDKLISEKFYSTLSATSVDLDRLRKLSWRGIPGQFRSLSWKLISMYMPRNQSDSKIILDRKREEYWNLVDRYFDQRFDPMYKEDFRQISIDCPRMSPQIKALHHPTIQRIFERILFLWAVKHPASGYVQGINDLIVPFFVVFMTDFVDVQDNVEDLETVLADIGDYNLRSLEADIFWCAWHMLDKVQDYYTHRQVGIQDKISQMEDIVKRYDDRLFEHLTSHNIMFLQFAFRWMNNLLTRELPMNCVIRLWDTYHAEGSTFSEFHLYVCIALLLCFRKAILRQDDFQSLMIFLQSLPTKNWQSRDITMLTAKAFHLKSLFSGSPSHLK